MQLSGGDDGLDGLDDNDFIGSDAGKTGLHALDRIQDLSIVFVPGRATPATHNALVQYCEVTRDGLCFAILDPPANAGTQEIIDYVQRDASLGDLTENAAIYWPRLENERIVDGLSEKMLSSPSNGPVSRRVEAALEMARMYEVNGVIHFSHWGCRQSCGGAPIIADAFHDQGIPCMILEGDGGDPSNYSSGQTQTRLEAFIEMLG